MSCSVHQTATVYPGIVFGACFVLNFFIWGKHSSGAVSVHICLFSPSSYFAVCFFLCVVFLCCLMALVLAFISLCVYVVFLICHYFYPFFIIYKKNNLVLKCQTKTVKGTSAASPNFINHFFYESNTLGIYFWIMFRYFTFVYCAYFVL